jgi:uncharacterized membrane protein
MILAAFLALIALVIAVMATAQLTNLRTRIEHLEMMLLSRPRMPNEPPLTSAAGPPPLPRTIAPPPPPLPVRPAPVQTRTPAAPRATGVNWESFVGVRLFAWIGGLALFLGVVFFVKYAFENNLVTPRMRVTAGGLVSVVLVGLGMLPSLRRYRIPAQSLIVTALLIAYADTYAAHSFYALIPLTLASIVMWLVTILALTLAIQTESPGIFWLGLIGGFLTPVLFRTGYENPVALFGYVAVLNLAVAAASVVKRWTYFVVAAAVLTVAIEFTWAAGLFGSGGSVSDRTVFLSFQGLFLLTAVALARARRSNLFVVAGAVIAALGPLLGFIIEPLASLASHDFGFLTLVLAATGLMALVAAHRNTPACARVGPAILALTLALICLAEWRWCFPVIAGGGNLPNGVVATVRLKLGLVAAWHAAIFLLFSATPYVCGDKPTWPWLVSAAAGPPQFWFVYEYLRGFQLDESIPPIVGDNWAWILPVAFTLPAAAALYFLVQRRGVKLSSGDNRLAAQGAALLTFVSLIFPVQFHREWITIGWALEALCLIGLFHWVPNRRLRAVALIVFSAAFVRLALNPAVLSYHPRTHVPILNWYLYAYGLAGLCMFAGAQWFGEPRERLYELNGPPLLYTLSGLVFFLLLNIEIADYFSIGPTLTFAFGGNFARDMTYTISWSLSALLLLIVGMVRRIRPLRLAALGLLCLALAKLFLHDLDSLNELYRIAAFISVAIIAIVASFAYQRFLSPAADK